MHSRRNSAAYIVDDAVDEKLGPAKDHTQLVRKLAGWLSHDGRENETGGSGL